MTALVKLFRTTAFKLALGLLATFAITAVFALGYVVWQSSLMIQQQIAETVQTEVTVLEEEYRAQGLRGLAAAIDERARQPGSLLYLFTTPTGQPIAGNVGALPPGTLDKAGTAEIRYARLGEDGDARARAHVQVVVLPAGFRMLVGRDLSERGRFTEILARAILGGLVLVTVLGLLGGLVVASRVLTRLDVMTETSRSIMMGDLSRRLPVTGTGDEFDRLAVATNAMLERIGELMTELKQVTDNVAHDLKTPLTRLRNRAEEALRLSRNEDDYRTALERVIEESDQLIATFNAMLIIARAEAGMTREALRPLAAAELVEGVCELYEPVVEEEGAMLTAQATPGLIISGNRELLGQALANLIDNALKYGMPAEGERTITLAAERRGRTVRLWVADRGPGIPPEQHAKALERFGRLEESRTRPGSGLGLSLAQAVAKLHGGALRLEDNGPGLRAVIELPLRDIATEDAALRRS